ncbi:MAG: hypothetical protein Q4E07_05545 [Eubacteriales bacterium]|nr:hypothetical protein [Eubacteriales bacterium]
MNDTLLILDYNYKYTEDIAKKLRIEGIACHVLPGDATPSEVQALAPLGIILAGGTSENYPLSIDGRLMHSGIPVLALGNTAASLCLLLNGKPEAPLQLNSVEEVELLPSPVTEGLSTSDRMIHACIPFNLSGELSPIAMLNEHIIGFKHQELNLYALGFQIESNDPDGTAILLNFALNVCGTSRWWDEFAFISNTRSHIQKEVGEGLAICALTGGLDSGVSATLAHRALGERLRCIFVDTGLLRQGEVEFVLSHYRDKENLSITLINAQDEFLSSLKGLIDPVEKQKAISDTMKKVLADVLHDTEYDAVIRGITCEEVLKHGLHDAIVPSKGKTVIAPLKEMFKTEVRYIAEKLGMAKEITSAQPFPGTGLALRIYGEVTKTRLDILKTVDKMFVEEISNRDLTRKLFKFFACLYPVQGSRSDEVLIALRAVTVADTREGASILLPSRMPFDVLENLSSKIKDCCPQVSRVTYDFTSIKNTAN